jgi:endonuclease/exonuclease/phosphatase family metal-dependent hydrolase
MTFLGLGFLIIAATTLFIILIWLFLNRKVFVVLRLVFFIAGYRNLSASIAINPSPNFNHKKDTAALRVITWNVRYFDNNAKHADSPNAVRRKMINYLRNLNADVMLFQDYVDYYGRETYSNISTMRDSLGYKYCYTTKDALGHNSNGDSEQGVAIFSRYPIVDTGKIKYPIQESIGYADIRYKNKTFRVLTTHLLSTGIHPSLEYDDGYRNYDSAMEYSKSVITRLKYFDQVHAQQAELVKQAVLKSPHPVIVTGDFNSVPSSYVYHIIKGNLDDVFVKKGFGLGHTYKGLSKTLRIDYLLVDPSFTILQYTSPRLLLSDHFPVITDLEWK